jgi:hypothetical protein
VPRSDGIREVHDAVANQRTEDARAHVVGLVRAADVVVLIGNPTVGREMARHHGHGGREEDRDEHR